MTLVRTVFIALAILLPVSWTAARAADPAPPAGNGTAADKSGTKDGAKGGTKDTAPRKSYKIP